VKALQDNQAEEVVMKKFVICILTLLVLVPLAPLAASADYVTNTTQVLPYQGSIQSQTSGYTTWMDNIPGGTGSLFKIFGYEVVTNSNNADVTLNIFTNMPRTGDPDTNLPTPCPVGDLFLNLGGNFETNGFTTALDISEGTLRTVTGASDYNTSKQLWNPYGGWIYAGEYRTGASSSGNAPVQALGTAGPTDITASWILNPTNHPGTWELSVLFPGLDGNNGNDLVFLWTSGTCANGVIFGDYEQPVSPPQVPVPPSALLLGTGILGLAILRKSRVER
jgi:hypothetical protein